MYKTQKDGHPSPLFPLALLVVPNTTQIAFLISLKSLYLLLHQYFCRNLCIYLCSCHGSLYVRLLVQLSQIVAKDLYLFVLGWPMLPERKCGSMWGIGKKRTKLGKWLDRKGYSQEDLIHASGVSRNTISKLCSVKFATYDPSTGTMRKIMKAVREIDSGKDASDFWDI